MSDLKIIPNGHVRRYQLIKVTKNCYRIVRILKEYETEEEASQELIKLLQGKLTDEDLLKDLKHATEE